MKLKSTAAKKKKNTSFRNNLVNKDRLTPYLEKAIAEGEFHWEYAFNGKESDDAWHPSGHCTPSISDLYHYATEGHKEERKFTSGLLKTFQVGHFWHQYLQWIVLHKLEFATAGAIEREGGLIWHENGSTSYYRNGGPPPVTPRPYHWARGSADIAPLVLPDWQGVVDYKTMGNHDYRLPGLPGWCSFKYEAQINIYMDFFEEERGLIVAIQKDSPHDMREFEFERNQPLIDAIHDKWHIVSEYLDEGEAPDPEHDIELHDLYTGPVER